MIFKLSQIFVDVHKLVASTCFLPESSVVHVAYSLKNSHCDVIQSTKFKHLYIVAALSLIFSFSAARCCWMQHTGIWKQFVPVVGKTEAIISPVSKLEITRQHSASIKLMQQINIGYWHHLQIWPPAIVWINWCIFMFLSIKKQRFM